MLLILLNWGALLYLRVMVQNQVANIMLESTFSWQKVGQECYKILRFDMKFMVLWRGQNIVNKRWEGYYKLSNETSNCMKTFGLALERAWFLTGTIVWVFEIRLIRFTNIVNWQWSWELRYFSTSHDLFCYRFLKLLQSMLFPQTDSFLFSYLASLFCIELNSLFLQLCLQAAVHFTLYGLLVLLCFIDSSFSY